MECHADAAFLPWNPERYFSLDPDWGVYDYNGKLIDAAALKHGGGKLSGQCEVATQGLDDLPTLPNDTYVYGGPLIAHYGHFLTETLARLWAIRDCLPAKVLFHGIGDLRGVLKVFPFIAHVFGRIGLSSDNAVFITDRVRIPRLVVPRPAFVTQSYAHPVFRKFCLELGAPWATPDQHKKGPAYISKSVLSAAVTRFSGEAAIDEFMRENGIEVIHPEKLRFPEQVRLFSENRTFIGTVGSAFHTSLLIRSGRFILLNGASQVNSNFNLVDQLCGHRTTYLYDPHSEILPESSAMTFALADPVSTARELLSYAL